jgi:hypothetical protein
MNFSPGDAIKFGWETFKQRPWFFIGAMIILAVANIAVGIITGAVDSAAGGSFEEPTLLGNLVSYLLGVLISMGLTAFFLAAHDNPRGVDFATLWHPSPYWKFFGTSVLASLAVGIGFLLLIVPGLIAMVLFMFSTFLVIDRGLGPIEALKGSIEMTQGNRWTLFGFILLCMLIIFVGVLALGVGLLVAVPIVGLAFAYAYRLLSSGGSPQIQSMDSGLQA